MLDPDGAYGVAVLDVEDRAAASAICAADPVLLANLKFTYKLLDMPKTLVKAPSVNQPSTAAALV